MIAVGLVAVPVFSARGALIARNVIPAPRQAEVMVANPEANAWKSPSFRGRPFWPVFAKLSHEGGPHSANRPVEASGLGLEGLPLTQEYASLLETHKYKAGIAKYRASRLFAHSRRKVAKYMV